MAPVERRDGEAYEALWDELRGSGFTRVRVDGQSVSLDEPPKLSHRRKHRVEVVVDRAVVRRVDPVAAGRLGRVGARPGQGGRPASPGSTTTRTRRSWHVDRYSQHRVCDGCGRSFEELSPHHFSFNSPLGWCPVCEGLGTQHGANPAVLIPDGRKSLRGGAVAVWPDFAENPLFARMIEALAEAQGIDLDTPFDELEGRHRRAILHGTGETWFAVPAGDGQPGVLVPVQGALPGDRGGRAGLVRLSLQAPGDGRRRPLRGLHGGAAPRRRRGRPVPRLHARPDRPVAARPGATPSSRA